MVLQSTVERLLSADSNPTRLRGAFEIRKRLFVDEMGWGLDVFDDIETDVYDGPAARYIVVSDNHGRILGTTRLIPTNTTHINGHSYMIKDASLGRISGMPQDLMENPPSSPSIWEATRFAVDTSLEVEDRNNVLKMVCDGATSCAKSSGVSEILGLMSPFFLRWLPRHGYTVEKASETVRIGGDPTCVIRYIL